MGCIGMQVMHARMRARVRLSRAWDDANGDARGDRGTMVDALARVAREATTTTTTTATDDEDEDEVAATATATATARW